jgi:hypothetical protein
MVNELLHRTHSISIYQKMVSQALLGTCCLVVSHTQRAKGVDHYRFEDILDPPS